MSASANGLAKTTAKPWGMWAMIALGAIAFGATLPQLFTSTPGVDSMLKKPDEPKGDLRYSAPTPPDTVSAQPMLVRLAVGTVVVLGLCVGSLWGMKSWLAAGANGAGGPRVMRLAETLPLGNRCSLHLVQMGKNKVLVGTDGAGIKTIVPLSSAFEEILDEAVTDDDPDAENQQTAA